MPTDHRMTCDGSRFLPLLRPLEPELETYARRLLWAPQQAPDAIQNAVLRAFTAFGRYREQGSFRPWIFRILTREVWALNRKHAAIARHEFQLDPQALAQLQPSDSLPEPPAIDDILEPELEQALRTLTDNERAVLLLRGISEFRYREISNTQPWLVSHLTRCGALQRLMQPIWEGCARQQWSEHHLATLQSALDQNRFWSDWIQVLRKERAIGNDGIDRIRRNPTLLPDALFPLESRPKYPWVVNLLLRGIPRGWFYQEQVRYNLLFNRAVLAPVDQPGGYADPDAIRAATAELNRALTRVGDVEAGTQPRVIRQHATDRPGASVLAALLDALQSVTQHRVMLAAFRMAPWDLISRHAIPARAHVSTDLAKTACAIERHRLAHGEFPATLDDLVPALLKEVPRDLIRGQPLVYRRLEDQSFLLYSIGWNGVDNGGQPATDPDTSPEVSSGDWVWPSTAMEE
jgi:RNA polymerase sigma factor (sigma-70 family)